jgi:hypothetical protein
LAKYVIPDLTRSEFSAGNREFSCRFASNPALLGLSGKITGFRDLKCALIAPIGGGIAQKTAFGTVREKKHTFPVTILPLWGYFADNPAAEHLP